MPIPSVRPYKTGLVDGKYVSASQSRLGKGNAAPPIGVSTINVPTTIQTGTTGTPTRPQVATAGAKVEAGSNVVTPLPQITKAPPLSVPPTGVGGDLNSLLENIRMREEEARANLENTIAERNKTVEDQIAAEKGLGTEAEQRKNAYDAQLKAQAESFSSTQEANLASELGAINGEFDLAKNNLLAQHNQQRELLLDRIGGAAGGNVGSKALELAAQMQNDQSRELAQLEALRAQRVSAARSGAYGADAEFQAAQRAEINQAQSDLDAAKQKIAENIIALRNGLTDSNKDTYEKVLAGLQQRAQQLQDQQNQLDAAKSAADSKSIEGRRKAATEQVQALTTELVTNGLTLDPFASKDILARIQTADNPEELAQAYIQQASAVPAVKALFTPKVKATGGGGGKGSSAQQDTYLSYLNDFINPQIAPDRSTALSLLERAKGKILVELGQSGYDQLWEEVQRMFPDYTSGATPGTTSASNGVIPGTPPSAIEDDIARLKKIPGFRDADVRATLRQTYTSDEVGNSSVKGNFIDQISRTIFGT